MSKKLWGTEKTAKIQFVVTPEQDAIILQVADIIQFTLKYAAHSLDDGNLDIYLEHDDRGRLSDEIKKTAGLFQIWKDLISQTIALSKVRSNKQGFRLTSKKEGENKRITLQASKASGHVEQVLKLTHFILKLSQSPVTKLIHWVHYPLAHHSNGEAGSAIVCKDFITQADSYLIGEALKKGFDCDHNLSKSVDPLSRLHAEMNMDASYAKRILNKFVVTSQVDHHMKESSVNEAEHKDFLAICAVFRLNHLKNNAAKIAVEGFINYQEKYDVVLRFPAKEALSVSTPYIDMSGPTSEGNCDARMACELIQMSLTLMRSDEPVIAKTLKSQEPPEINEAPNWGIVRIARERLYCFEPEDVMDLLTYQHSLKVKAAESRVAPVTVGISKP